MEAITYFFKLIVIFFGYGILTLAAYYTWKEFEKLGESLGIKFFKKDLEKLSIIKKAKVSPTSAFFEISFGQKKPIKIFSSLKEIRKV